MRDPRPGSAWSWGRVCARGRYAAWMASAGWAAGRAAWVTEWSRRYRAAPRCMACGAFWGPGDGDLHHRSYARLGTERFGDLWPMCRGCHEAWHRIWDASPAWRSLGREHATVGIVALLRNRVERVDG
ncbi:MAG TPA: hypothetical protein VFA11_19260 [Acidimicrobiales bacterium]|nr:hypothetical protein [Acidimicrobiales bacterium]